MGLMSPEPNTPLLAAGLVNVSVPLRLCRSQNLFGSEYPYKEHYRKGADLCQNLVPAISFVGDLPKCLEYSLLN